MAEFRRKPNRLAAESYRGRRAYFLTLCVCERKKVFTDGTLVSTLLALLEKTCAAHSFRVHAFCFMPDHLHLILVGESESSEVSPVIRALKGAATEVVRASSISSLWQKRYYDHVLRGGKSLDESAWYVFLNPVRAGLVKRAGEWPYSGSFVFARKVLARPPETFHPPWKGEVATGEKLKGKMAR